MKLYAIFLAILMFTPGCLDFNEEGIDQNEGYSTVRMEIFHGESLENASAKFTIIITLNHSAAPIHAQNMRTHVERGNYDMTHFHRIIDNFMIQGGDFVNHDGTGGHAAEWHEYCRGEYSTDSSCNGVGEKAWTIPDEADNGLQHFSCFISMAKTSPPNTGGSQFFIMPDDIEHHEHLDGVHTVFGEITEGCEHITTISEVETLDNDRPVIPVIIHNATIVE